MSVRAGYVWDDALLAYDFGPSHPLAPVRVDLAIRLAADLGVLDELAVLRPEPIDDAVLTLVHTREYVEAVRHAGEVGPGHADLAHGIGISDNPSFWGMHVSSARVVGATVAAVRAVVEGRLDRAANLAGGLHHAQRSAASGFCIYNDPAVGIAWALAHGVERVAYVDVDVHHGDGVEAAFWDDPRVLTVSIHESGDTLFPGTGRPEDVGGGGAEGTAVNLALPAFTGDDGWLRAFDAVVPEVVAAFEPNLLVTQGGCDSHADDPLAHLALSVDAQREGYARLRELAAVADGRWVALGGGGYALSDVVPRAWSHLLGIVADADVDPGTPVPESWRFHVLQRLGRTAPLRMTDGAHPHPIPWGDPVDDSRPWSGVDPAIRATREAVFPHLGLVP